MATAFIEQKTPDAIEVFRLDHDLYHPWVSVAVSRVLRDAFGLTEKGLFALRPFTKGDTIGHYTGAILPTMPDGDTRYVAQIRGPDGAQCYVDGEHAGPPYVQCINDARHTNQTNNARLLQSGRIVATRRIQRGAEILMSYGRDYWRTH